VFVWGHSVVHQTHGGIFGKFGAKSVSGVNGILQEFPEQMEFCGNLVWQTFSQDTEYLLNGIPREVKFHTPL
jgi:hypothetical protein